MIHSRSTRCPRETNAATRYITSSPPPSPIDAPITYAGYSIEVPEGDTCLQLQTVAGSKVLDIRPSARQVFRGRRVLFTLSKNNHPTWICDWMRFHRDLHAADAVLLYDNASTIYTADALLEKMNQVSGYSSICVVSWPYKYGPAGSRPGHVGLRIQPGWRDGRCSLALPCRCLCRA